MVAAGLLGDRLGVVTMLDVQGVLYVLAGVVAVAWMRPSRTDQGRMTRPRSTIRLGAARTRRSRRGSSG
jgi:hypothetical protein